MSNLGNQYISSSYQSVLNVGSGSGDYVTSTLKPLTDGYGTAVPIKVSTTGVELSGSISLTGSLVSSIIPAVSNSIDLGSPTKPFRHLYVGSGSIYLDDHQILSLDLPGVDTTIAAPPSGTVQLLNDVVFSSQEGLGYEGAAGFTIVGGGTQFVSQTKYSGDTISYHTGSHYLTNYWVNNLNQITGETALQLEVFKDNLKLATIENSRHLRTYEDSEYVLESKYQGTGSYNGAITHKFTDEVNSKYAQSNVGNNVVYQGAGIISGSTSVPKSNFTISEDSISANFTNQASSASFTLTSSLFEVTGAIAATDGYIGDVIGTASFASNAESASYASYASTALSASFAQDSDVANSAISAISADTLEGTGSAVFATTGSNTFNGSQTISGSLNVTGSITALSASITYLETIYQTSSVIFTSGSNILGDEASDVQTLNGTVNVPLGDLNVTGNTSVSGWVDATDYIATDNVLYTNHIEENLTNGGIDFVGGGFGFKFNNNIEVTGSVTASVGFVGDLQGTASYASNALSSSHSVNSDNSISSSQAENANLLDGKDSSEFATTGSNTFNGIETINGKVNINVSDAFNQALVINSGSGAQAQSIAFQTSEFGGASQPTIFMNGINSYWQSTGNLNIENSPGGFGSGSMNFTTNGGLSFTTNGTGQAINFNNGNGSINLTGSLTSKGNFNITGNTYQTGALLQSSSLPNEFTRVQIANSNKAFYGEANTLLSLVGDSQGIFDFYADGGNYDTLNITVDQNAGTTFRDWAGATYSNWLKIPTNTGGNPAPQFQRGLGITGSLLISGSADYDVDVTGRIKVGGPDTGNTPRLFVSSSAGNTIIGATGTQILKPNDNTIALNNSYGGFVGIAKASDSTEIGIGLDGSQVAAGWTTGPVLYVNNDPANSYNAVFGFQDKTNYTDGRITLLKNTDISGSLNVVGTTNTIIGNTYLTGTLLLSSSNANDLVIDGRALVRSAGTGGDAAQIQVSGSTLGTTTIQPASVSIQSGSLSGTFSKSIINHVDSTGAPTTNKYLGFSANPSLVGAPSLTGTTVPSIIAMNGSLQPEAVISFEHRGGYTDGRVTVLKPLKLNSGSFTSGSVNITGDTIQTGSIRVDGDLILDDDGTNTSILLNKNFGTEYKGYQLTWAETTNNIAINAYEREVNLYYSGYDTTGGTYDNGLFIDVDSNGTTFSDQLLPSYNRRNWLNIPGGATSSPQFKVGLGITGSLDVTGSVTIANAGDLTMYGHKMFNGAQYSTLQTLSGSANVSASVNFDTTGPQFGVSLVDNTKITVANAGTYNIQFSSQLLADTGADDVYIWFKKNGSNIAGSATRLEIANNEENVMTVNILDTANANDYYEIAWQSVNGDAVLYYEAASGNIPAVPSVITTVTQVR